MWAGIRLGWWIRVVTILLPPLEQLAKKYYGIYRGTLNKINLKNEIIFYIFTCKYSCCMP
jgi:hypothetical protein